MKNYIQKVAWALVLLLAATLSLSAKDGTAVRKLFKKGVSDSISVGGSKLVVLQKDLIRNRSLSVNSIGEENVPELDFAMTNVTAGGHGYRFLPHGTHFTGEGATVKIKYDRTRIPSGYTEDDIRTYYYDPAEKHWVALERVRVDKKEECVVSKTTHFTDMINGVIQAPESPQTEGFAPTMMNDIKAADPTAKLNVIAPTCSIRSRCRQHETACSQALACSTAARAVAVGLARVGTSACQALRLTPGGACLVMTSQKRRRLIFCLVQCSPLWMTTDRWESHTVARR